VPCGPARASLYTGLYLHNHRLVVNGAPLDARHSNVALEARKLGYDPVLFGYTDIAPDPRGLPPGDPALTTYEGVLPGMTPVLPITSAQHAWRNDLEKKGYDLPETDGDIVACFIPEEGVTGPGPTFAPARYKAEDSNTAFLTDAAMRHISESGARPWFLHISYLAPHPPFIVPAPYHDLYDPAKITPPLRAESVEAEAAQHPFLAETIFKPKGDGLIEGRPLKEHLTFDEAALCQAKATYFAMISEVDHQIGRLIDLLKAEGLYDRTLIVFTSDHGEQLGDHWLFGKNSYFEASYRIPLILRDPRPAADVSRGGKVQAFTEAVDIMPSLLDWLGGVPPRACDGRSLLPFLKGETPANWRQEAHWEYDFRSFAESRGAPVLGLLPEESAMIGQRGARYKLVQFTALPPLLFDLQEDPDEFTNLAEDPAHRDVLLAETQKLISWRMAHNERSLTHLRLTPKGVVELG
jgi:arylsulfatase A-like enzyme